MPDNRPTVYVNADHNPDDVRCFYEIPEALAKRILPNNDRRTFAGALADLLHLERPLIERIGDQEWEDD